MFKTKELPIPRGILTDVDRTLLDSNRQISAKNQAAIEKYLIEFKKNPQLPRLALCTARHPAALVNTVLPVFTKFAPDSLHVVCDGAMLINSKTEVFWQEAIDSVIVKEICETIEKIGGSFAFGNDDTIYSSKIFLEERQQAHEPIKHLPCTAIKNQENWSTTLIIVNHLNEAVEEYLKALRDKSSLHLQKIVSTFNHQYYYNITLNDVSKANGLKKWAEYYQLNPADIVMIGDSKNDFEAMKIGIGVAVANADPAVKEVARLVLEQSNDEDAVACFLQELLKITTTI